MAADVAYAVKKALDCNTSENVLVAIFNMTQEELPDSLEKLEQMCGKQMSSKIISLATPVEDDGMCLMVCVCIAVK